MKCIFKRNISSLFLVISFTLVGCGAEKIDPLFPKSELAQELGDGEIITITTKVPLTSRMFGHYDASAVLDDPALDREQKIAFSTLFRGIKYRFYDLGLSLGIGTAQQVGFDFTLPQIDFDILHSIQIKKVFVMLKNCDYGEVHCAFSENRKRSNAIGFDFLKSFFLNINIGMSEGAENEDASSYKKLKLQAKNQWLEENEITEEGPFTKTLVYFDEKIRLPDDPSNSALSNENPLILILDLDPKVSKSKKIETAKIFRSELLRPYIDEITFIGDHLYVKIKSAKDREEFFKKLGSLVGGVSQLGVTSFRECRPNQCITLEVKPLDFSSLLKNGASINFDAFFELGRLELRDFHYGGFVEVELQLRPGI